jgi:hypothetical protein
MNELPTIKEELERKTVDVLVRLEKDLLDSKINSDQYNEARRMIFDIVSGLVGIEIIELLSFKE